MVMAMAKVIQFYVPDEFRKQSGKWIPPIQRGNVIPFPAQERSQHDITDCVGPHAPANPLLRKVVGSDNGQKSSTINVL
jgi:hypothetical protein